MYEDFINSLSTQVRQRGYTVESNPVMLNVRALLYASSPQLTSVGPIKFFNHYLFLGWENDLFGRLEQLKEARKNFTDQVNKKYRVPRAWRVKIPNLAVVAVSQQRFTPDVISYVENNWFVPFVGGEAGQIILLDLENHEMFDHHPPRYKQYGSIPLTFAVKEIRMMFEIYNQSK
jgi:hypothetical protein